MVRGDGHLGGTRARRHRPSDSTPTSSASRLADEEPSIGHATTSNSPGIDLRVSVPGRRPGARQSGRSHAIAAATSRPSGGSSEWPTDPSRPSGAGVPLRHLRRRGLLQPGILRICNTDDEIITWTQRCLDRFGFRHVVEDHGHPNRVRYVRLVGGPAASPAVLPHHRPGDHTQAHDRRHGDQERRAASGWSPIEPLGIDLPMYDITTGTGDFIANGVVSHNCFARPTHTYLDLDADRDFERRIVVKVNAVSHLRASSTRRRWRGDLIAMGTNTDPYQRAEGKYRLTRGIVEVLTEFANPFSILTKSTLVLRDLALLAEAAQRTERAGQPVDRHARRGGVAGHRAGTPHPAPGAGRRAAQRRGRSLRRADGPGPARPVRRPDQLEDVVRACVGGRAASISTVLLHLRPGVNERLPGPAGRDPSPPRRRDTAPLPRPGLHRPRADQQALATQVRRPGRRHGGQDPAEWRGQRVMATAPGRAVVIHPVALAAAEAARSHPAVGARGRPAACSRRLDARQPQRAAGRRRWRGRRGRTTRSTAPRP